MTITNTRPAGVPFLGVRRYTAPDIIYSGADLPSHFVSAQAYDQLRGELDMASAALFNTNNTAEAYAARVTALQGTVASLQAVITELGQKSRQRAVEDAQRGSADPHHHLMKGRAL